MTTDLRVRSILETVRRRRPSFFAGRSRECVWQQQLRAGSRHLGGCDAQHVAGRESTATAHLAQLPAVGRAAHRRRAQSQEPGRAGQ